MAVKKMDIKRFVADIMERMQIKNKLRNFSAKEKEAYLISIVDTIFLFIETDRKSMQNYLNLVYNYKGNNTNIRYINGNIAMKIKDALNLKERGTCRNPESIIIQTYTRFAEK